MFGSESNLDNSGTYVGTSSRNFFFFQAEDGIRDLTVTGVQTCALPISMTYKCWQGPTRPVSNGGTVVRLVLQSNEDAPAHARDGFARLGTPIDEDVLERARSEERREGKRGAGAVGRMLRRR